MNVQELSDKFQALDISRRKYTLLTGRLPDQAMCMEKTDGEWLVYYSERGRKFDIKHFSAESEACEYMYERVLHIAHISL